MILKIFCILVNGSLGALVERGPKSSNLAGIFIEVNNQKYGGYFSIAGMSKEEVANQFRIFTCVNLGITYFMKERLGIVLFGGLFENSCLGDYLKIRIGSMIFPIIIFTGTDLELSW